MQKVWGSIPSTSKGSWIEGDGTEDQSTQSIPERIHNGLIQWKAAFYVYSFVMEGPKVQSPTSPTKGPEVEGSVKDHCLRPGRAALRDPWFHSV